MQTEALCPASSSIRIVRQPSPRTVSRPPSRCPVNRVVASSNQRVELVGAYEVPKSCILLGNSLVGAEGPGALRTTPDRHLATATRLAKPDPSRAKRVHVGLEGSVRSGACCRDGEATNRRDRVRASERWAPCAPASPPRFLAPGDPAAPKSVRALTMAVSVCEVMLVVIVLLQVRGSSAPGESPRVGRVYGCGPPLFRRPRARSSLSDALADSHAGLPRREVLARDAATGRPSALLPAGARVPV